MADNINRGICLLKSTSGGGSVNIATSRFGEIQVNKNDLILFNEGILGFETNRKFFLVDPGDNTLVMWLQSVECKELAFPIIEPKIFCPSYSITLAGSDRNFLKLENGLSDASVFVILTIPENVIKMTANLKAPIVINNKTNHGKQVVLQNNKLSVKTEIYLDLKKGLVNFKNRQVPNNLEVPVRKIDQLPLEK